MAKKKGKGKGDQAGGPQGGSPGSGAGRPRKGEPDDARREAGKAMAERRYDIFDYEQVQEMYDQLISAAEKMQGLLNSMKEHQVSEIRVDGSTKFRRGMKLVRAGMENVEVGVVRARYNY